MGSKSNPGKYDCYAKAEPDEPMFILLARDLYAPALVDRWANMREETFKRGGSSGEPEEMAKIAEARKCANEMRDWRQFKETGSILRKRLKKK